MKRFTEKKNSISGLAALLVFGIFAVCGLLFSALMQLLHISEWVDFVVLTIGLIAAAISTIRFKL